MNPVVQTRYGALRGAEENGVLVFRGVPFAAPPVGELRFGPPQPPQSWSGERDATRYGTAALQAARASAPLLGITLPLQGEDCLNLNIWTPAIGAGTRPVYVWVHGGAWVIGSGSEASYNGSRLARRGDVVVVTLNYRLGAFGFLRGKELGDAQLDSSGNEALLDVIAALAWVRDEIAAFGGDPGNVTLGGESAGSANTGVLLTSARARGLFHKAIMQSGSPSLTVSPAAATATARAVLDRLGIAPEQAARLRDVPAAELLAAQNASAAATTAVSWAPVADDDVVAARPFAAIAAGSARGVPLLIGTNAEEMKLYSFMDPSLAQVDEARLNALAGALFPGQVEDGVSNAARVLAAYRDSRSARGESIEPAELASALSTDQVFRAGAMKLAELHAAHTPQTYAYLFDWKATAPGGPQGAAHAMDLPFTFGTLDLSKLGEYVGRGPDAVALSATIQDAWLSFMRTGSPRTEALPQWEPYAPPRRATMVLGAHPHLVDAPMEAERACWEPYFA